MFRGFITIIFTQITDWSKLGNSSEIGKCLGFSTAAAVLFEHGQKSRILMQFYDSHQQYLVWGSKTQYLVWGSKTDRTYMADIFFWTKCIYKGIMAENLV